MEVKDRNKKNKGHEQQLTESNKGPGKHAQELTDELTLARKKLRNEVKERRAAEKDLLEQMTLFEAFFASTVTPLVLLDKDFNFIRVNEAYAKACQRDIWEFPGRNHFEMYPSDTRAIFEEVVRTKIPFKATERPFTFQDHPEWGETYWNWNLTPLLDNKGEVEFLVFSLEDVTGRKETERSAAVTNTFLKLFSEKSLRKEYLDGVVEQILLWSGCACGGVRVLDEQGNIPYESYVGFSREFWELENWLCLGETSCACTRVVLGERETQDTPCLTPGGSFFSNNTMMFLDGLSEEEKKRFRGTCIKTGYKSVAVVPIRHRDKIIGAIHLADKSAEKVPLKIVEFLESTSLLIGEAIHRFSMEQALRLANRYNRSLIEASLDPMVTISHEGRIDDVNRATELVTGFSRDELIGTDFSDYFTEPEKARTGYKLVFKEGSVRDYELEIRHRDGHVTPVLYHASVYKDETGKTVGVFAVARDITEKTKLEKELRQTQKMQAIGTLAGGIAHDFNNIIAGIIGFTEMVLEDVAGENPAHRRLELVLKGAYRGRDLVKQILAFSRRSEQEKKPVSMSLILNEVMPLIRASLPSTIEIRKNISTRSDVVSADQTQTHQVIMNLCTNAAHAMRDQGGVLEISLADERFDEDGRDLYQGLRPGYYVRLTVSDTGCGMEPEVMERIFDPFFTTKAPGEGTGLGLSVVHGIVRSHDGAITVYSEPGQGSSFHVYLPKITSDSSAEVKDITAAIGGKERILVVDDEDLLIEMNKQRLERLGYDAVGKTSSMEALEAFRIEPDKFDLVITDYTMPHMTGIDLARELLLLRPDIPIVMCSGLNEPVPREKVKETGIQELVAKPIDKDEFAKLIRRVLDRSK